MCAGTPIIKLLTEELAANKISMISKENELIMKGNAYLNRDGFDISADLIHYNFKSNKIIRSINSTIQSDS